MSGCWTFFFFFFFHGSSVISMSSPVHEVVCGRHVSTDCFKMKDAPSVDHSLKQPHNLTGSPRIVRSSFHPKGTSAFHLMKTWCEWTGRRAARPFGFAGSTSATFECNSSPEESWKPVWQMLNMWTEAHSPFEFRDAQRRRYADVAEFASSPELSPFFFPFKLSRCEMALHNVVSVVSVWGRFKRVSLVDAS